MIRPRLGAVAGVAVAPRVVLNRSVRAHATSMQLGAAIENPTARAPVASDDLCARGGRPVRT